MIINSLEELDKVLASVIVSSGCLYYPYGSGNKYIAQENGVWMACDNEDGRAWTEDFKTKSSAVYWLNGRKRK